MQTHTTCGNFAHGTWKPLPNEAHHLHTTLATWPGHKARGGPRASGKEPRTKGLPGQWRMSAPTFARAWIHQSGRWPCNELWPSPSAMLHTWDWALGGAHLALYQFLGCAEVTRKPPWSSPLRSLSSPALLPVPSLPSFPRRLIPSSAATQPQKQLFIPGPPVRPQLQINRYVDLCE